jgi:hypothetical protein
MGGKLVSAGLSLSALSLAGCERQLPCGDRCKEYVVHPDSGFAIHCIFNPLLHIRAPLVRLGAHRLALDSLGARVVLAGILADAGGARVGGDGRLAGTVAVGVAGGVVGAETLLLGLLLLELLAGAGAAAGEGC